MDQYSLMLQILANTPAAIGEVKDTMRRVGVMLLGSSDAQGHGARRNTCSDVFWRADKIVTVLAPGLWLRCWSCIDSSNQTVIQQ